MDSKPAGTGRAGEGSRGSWAAAASTLHIEVMMGKPATKKET
ncbi:hypothetical protein [Paenibacillus lactis]